MYSNSQKHYELSNNIMRKPEINKFSKNDIMILNYADVTFI